MPTYSDQELLTFNQIVLQVQDRAYTLAVCLLGEVPLYFVKLPDCRNSGIYCFACFG